MDRELLQEYENRENDEFSKFHKHLLEGNVGLDQIYPPLSRFAKIRNPLSRAYQHMFNPDNPPILWPQIPLTGSLLVLLYPVRREHFKEIHGFDAKDIPDLVDFTKETGRVQFQLASSPTSFEGLDYLDPFFAELRPPLAKGIETEYLFSAKERKRHKIEFVEYYNLSLRRTLDPSLREYGFTNGAIAETAGGLYGTYLWLRFLGRHDLAERILTLMIEDPRAAYATLIAYSELLGKPLSDTLPSFYNLDLSFMQFASRYLNEEDSAQMLSEVKFPYEIGAFLIKKLTPYSQSFRSMQYMIDRYEQEELYRLMEDLSKAIRSKSCDLFNMKIADIDGILDNVWKDGKHIRQEIKEVDFGISLALGVIGPIVGYLSADVPGLLTAMGLSVLDASANFFGGLASKIVRKLRPGYLVTLYDFQNKHSIQ